MIDFLSGHLGNNDILDDAIKLIGLIGTDLDQVHSEIFNDEIWYHLLSYYKRSPEKFAKLMRTLIVRCEKLFHITPKFFSIIFDLFM